MRPCEPFTSGGSPALSYLLYFRPVAIIGPVSSIAEAFLIPAFAADWAEIFLGAMP